MNLATALRSLSAATDHVPFEAIAWLTQTWDRSSTAALQVLARVAKDPENAPDSDLASAYFLLHVCAEKRETKAFPLLCSLSKDPAGIDDILGDALLVVQAPITISLFDGNTAALRSILESPEATVDTKASTFAALAWLTAAGQADRALVEAHLAAFPEKAKGDTLAGWDGWAMAIALIGHEGLMEKVRAAYADPDQAELMPELKEVEDVFRIAREESDPLTVFAREGLAPVNSALERLEATEHELREALAQDGEEEAPEEDEEEEAEAPVSNPFRNVGRNDACPCGSGKKFKKCCMAA